MNCAIVRWFDGAMVSLRDRQRRSWQSPVFNCLLGIASLSLAMTAPVFASASSKIHPIKLYDHQMHTDSFFTPSNVPCEGCHINEQYEWKGMNHDGCHNCHRESKWLDYASKDCSRCHAKWPVKPKNHKVNWIAQHKTEAKASPVSCKSCHNDRFCIKCHEQRGSINLNVHKRNFRYFHSIEARADPKKCDRCHVVQFCTNCHK